MADHVPTYDLEEATDIIARTAESYSADHDGREKALVRLLQDLLSITPPPGLKIRDDPQRGVYIGNHALQLHVWLSIETVGLRATYPRDGGSELIAGIEYNPTMKLYEGMEADTFHVQIPGQRVRKRSAAAVVAQRVQAILAGATNPAPRVDTSNVRRR